MQERRKGSTKREEIESEKQTIKNKTKVRQNKRKKENEGKKTQEILKEKGNEGINRKIWRQAKKEQN
jgi:hypothetical protein